MIGKILRIRYEILSAMEEGPLFQSYHAKDRVLGREVVIRVINEPFASEPTFLIAVAKIVQKSASMPHPAIERMLEMDDHEGIKFIVCESSLGEPLNARILKLAPFSAGICIGIGIELCGALTVLHEAGVVHGDLSSRNITATVENRVRVANAGLWETFSQSRTAGSVVLPYMAPYLAPEITNGEMPNPRSDIYALGVIMVELLIGRHPFASDTPMGMAVKHATTDVPSLRTINPNVPLVLDEIVLKMLKKDKFERYAEVKQLLSDLRIVQDGLRFGRQLTWPLDRPNPDNIFVNPNASAAAKTVEEVLAQAPVTTQPALNIGTYEKTKPLEADASLVAPRMGAARKESGKKENVKEISDSAPKWLQATAYVMTMGVIVIVGGFFYWNLTKPKTIMMPNIKLMSARDAALKLKPLKLKLKVIKRESSNTYVENTILEANPAYKQQIKEGSTVNVIISSGSRTVTVPSLIGHSVQEAKDDFLAPLGLQLREPVKRAYSDRYRAGQIMDQTPDKGMTIEKDSGKVTVTVSKGPREPGGDQANAPAENEKFVLKLKMNPSDPITEVSVTVIDDQGEREVYRGELSGESPEQSIIIAATGANPQYKIYYNGTARSTGALKKNDAR